MTVRVFAGAAVRMSEALRFHCLPRLPAAAGGGAGGAGDAVAVAGTAAVVAGGVGAGAGSACLPARPGGREVRSLRNRTATAQRGQHHRRRGDCDCHGRWLSFCAEHPTGRTTCQGQR